MTTLQQQSPWLIQELSGELSGKQKLGTATLLLIGLFFFIGTLLQLIDPTAGIMDIGILSVAVFGFLLALAAFFCSLWLQEILWQPFKTFRREIRYHFNQLTSWQQCILYFAVFFLWVFAILWALSIIL